MRSNVKSVTATPSAALNHSAVRSDGRSMTSVMRTGRRGVAHVGRCSDDIKGRVAVEESERLEPERHDVDGHHRPILGPGDVVDAGHVDWKTTRLNSSTIP